MDVEEVKVQRPALRTRGPQQWEYFTAPVIAAINSSVQGSIRCLLRQTTSMHPAAAKATTAQLTDKAAQASATKASTPEPIDKPGTASAAEASTADAQFGSKISNHCN